MLHITENDFKVIPGGPYEHNNADQPNHKNINATSSTKYSLDVSSSILDAQTLIKQEEFVEPHEDMDNDDSTYTQEPPVKIEFINYNIVTDDIKSTKEL